MQCESRLADGFYWVYFDNEWNMLRYDGEDFWWTDGAACYKADGCVVLPVYEPRSDDDYLAALGIRR